MSNELPIFPFSSLIFGSCFSHLLFVRVPRKAPRDNYREASTQIHRRDGVVVRASASQSVDVGFISPSRVIPKNFKKCFSQLPCLALCTIGIVWRTSRQGCLLCLLARHLTGCLHFHVADRWWGQAVYPSWWSSPTKDPKTELERTRSVCTSSCILLRTNSSNDKGEEER